MSAYGVAAEIRNFLFLKCCFIQHPYFQECKCCSKKYLFVYTVLWVITVHSGQNNFLSNCDWLDLFTWPFQDILGRLTRSTAHCHIVEERRMFLCVLCLSGVVIVTFNCSCCIVWMYMLDAGDHGELFWSNFGWDDSHPDAHTEAKYTGIMPVLFILKWGCFQGPARAIWFYLQQEPSPVVTGPPLWQQPPPYAEAPQGKPPPYNPSNYWRIKGLGFLPTVTI